MQGLEKVVLVVGICHGKPNPVLDQFPFGEGAEVVANDYVFNPFSGCDHNRRLTHQFVLYSLDDHSIVRADGWVGLSKNVRSHGWRSPSATGMCRKERFLDRPTQPSANSQGQTIEDQT